MNFAIVGTLSSYVKTKTLTFAAKHKIRTGQTITNSNGNFVSIMTPSFGKISEAVKTSNAQAKQAKLKRIKQKLMSGKKISDEEMGFLRVNDPKSYSKAKHAEEAREELKAELKKAKSKSEAREAMTRAMIKASTEAMAELGALGQCNGAMGGGSASTSQGGEIISTGDAGAIFGGSEGSSNAPQSQAESNANISDAENQTLGEVNQSNETSEEKVSGEKINDKQDVDKKSDEKNFFIQKKSDADSTTPDDIMEKYIMTIRALEDEWNRFANSDEYKNLPENTLDETEDEAKKRIRRQISAPNRKSVEAIALYRKSMLFSLEDL